MIWLLLTLAMAGETLKPPASLEAYTLHLASGSGFVVKTPSGKSRILTNWHVCISSVASGRLQGSMHDGTSLRGKVIKVSPTSDLCMAEIGPEAKGQGLELGAFPSPGEAVCTAGYPAGVYTKSCGHVRLPGVYDADFELSRLGSCPPKFRPLKGVNGAVAACGYTFDFIGTTLYARPGCSGSPVVNKKGQLVGVVSSWHEENNYDAGMVPYHLLAEFLKGE